MRAREANFSYKEWSETNDIKREDGDDIVLELHANFELNLSVHARTGRQNARARTFSQRQWR
jgi:hypothetical protein